MDTSRTSYQIYSDISFVDPIKTINNISKKNISSDSKRRNLVPLTNVSYTVHNTTCTKPTLAPKARTKTVPQFQPILIMKIIGPTTKPIHARTCNDERASKAIENKPDDDVP